MLVDSLLLVHDGLGEQWTRLIDELSQSLRTRTQQLEQPMERARLGHERMRAKTCVVEERLRGGSEILDRHPRDVLPVHPIELLGVEDGVSTADPFEREAVDQFLRRHQLAIVTGRPPKQREEVHDRGCEVSLPLIFHHRRRAMPLAQSLLVRAENERHVREARH